VLKLVRHGILASRTMLQPGGAVGRELLPGRAMDESFNRLVASAVREMAEEPTLVATVERAVEMCTHAMRSCDMVGISVMEGGQIRTVAASNEVLRQIDQWQFELGQGPCYDALREHETVTANDLAHDDRWPLYGQRLAQETGIHSSVSYRLFTNGDSLGALNVYARARSAFSHQDVAEGQALAAHAAAALATSLKEHQLQQALETRTVIGQATGMLMERFGLDADAAFGALRRISQNGNIKLYAVAERLVATGRLPQIRRGTDQSSEHR
jgi:GAF domain-containing protein